jgi:hypothetical protein
VKFEPARATPNRLGSKSVTKPLRDIPHAEDEAEQFNSIGSRTVIDKVVKAPKHGAAHVLSNLDTRFWKVAYVFDQR